MTLSGSGLQTPRTLTVNDKPGASSGWRISDAYRDGAVRALSSVAAAHRERSFWAIQLPTMLAIGAILLVASASFGIIRMRREPARKAANSTQKINHRADGTSAKGATYAAH